MDDTLEVRECHTANDGRDPFPVLIGRHKVPVDRDATPSSFPGSVMELSEHEIKNYFTPKDFKVGETVTIYGRRFRVYDCDNFTKGFYYHNFGITEFKTVDVNPKLKDLPKMVTIFLFTNIINCSLNSYILLIHTINIELLKMLGNKMFKLTSILT